MDCFVGKDGNTYVEVHLQELLELPLVPAPGKAVGDAVLAAVLARAGLRASDYGSQELHTRKGTRGTVWFALLMPKA